MTFSFSAILELNDTLILAGITFIVCLTATLIMYEHCKYKCNTELTVICSRELNLILQESKMKSFCTRISVEGFEEDHDYNYFRLRLRKSDANFFYDRGKREMSHEGASMLCSDESFKKSLLVFFHTLEDRYQFTKDYMHVLQTFSEYRMSINTNNAIMTRVFSWMCLGYALWMIHQREGLDIGYCLFVLLIFLIIERYAKL